MIESQIPMCKKNAVTFVAVVLLAVALLFAIGYYLFHEAGGSSILHPTNAMLVPDAKQVLPGYWS